MIARWIWLVLMTLWWMGCGEATVRPFSEISDAGIDDGGGDDDGGDDDEVDGGEDEPDDPAMHDSGRT